MAFFRNMTSLFVVTVGGYFIPLATVPYLARVLGVEPFGVLGVATGLIAYAILVSDWGFALSATQMVARNQGNPRALRRIFWATLWAKAMLGVFATGTLLVLVLTLPTLRANLVIVAAMLTQLLGSILTVSWFLQGLERMVALAFSSFLIRLATLPATFLLVHGPGDLLIAAFIPGLAMIGVGIASLILSVRAVPLWPMRPPTRAMLHTIREGTTIFITMAAISLYTQANVIAVGLMAGDAQAGLFHGADRIKKALQGLMGPIGNAAYPRINALLATEPAKAKRFMLLLLVGQGIAAVGIFGGTLLLAPLIIKIALGKAFLDAVPTLRWLAAIPLLVGFSNVFGINMLLPFGAKKTVSHITIAAGVLNLCLIVPFAHVWGAEGGAISVVIAEIFVTVTMGFAAYRHFTQRFGPVTR